jgi:hypothetical protein
VPTILESRSLGVSAAELREQKLTAPDPDDWVSSYPSVSATHADRSLSWRKRWSTAYA